MKVLSRHWLELKLQCSLHCYLHAEPSLMFWCLLVSAKAGYYDELNSVYSTHNITQIATQNLISKNVKINICWPAGKISTSTEDWGLLLTDMTWRTVSVPVLACDQDPGVGEGELPGQTWDCPQPVGHVQTWNRISKVICISQNFLSESNLIQFCLCLAFRESCAHF